MIPQKDGKYILGTDASHNTSGALLSQVQGREERVLYYASTSLTKSHRQYCMTRQKRFAIYTFVLKFKHYLFGKQFEVRTEHRFVHYFLLLSLWGHRHRLLFRSLFLLSYFLLSCLHIFQVGPSCFIIALPLRSIYASPKYYFLLAICAIACSMSGNRSLRCLSFNAAFI